jgi:hypothetical protein
MNSANSWECQGRDEKGQFGSGTCGAIQHVPLGLDTSANIKGLGAIIQTEAGGELKAEKVAVGFTVLNRMLRNRSIRVADVVSAYASH